MEGEMTARDGWVGLGYLLSPNLQPGPGSALLPPTHLGHKDRS